MSLVAERPTVRRPSSSRSTTVRRRPSTAARNRPRPARRRRTGSLVASVLAVACVTLFTFVFSSVVGNTVLEKTRRDRIRAVERTKDSREEVARLRRVLNGMTSMESVDRFAMANGMVLSGVEGQPVAPVIPAGSSEARSIVAAVDSNSSPTLVADLSVSTDGTNTR